MATATLGITAGIPAASRGLRQHHYCAPGAGIGPRLAAGANHLSSCRGASGQWYRHTDPVSGTSRAASGHTTPGGPGNHRGGDPAADCHWRKRRPYLHVWRHDCRRRGLPVPRRLLESPAALLPAAGYRHRDHGDWRQSYACRRDVAQRRARLWCPGHQHHRTRARTRHTAACTPDHALWPRPSRPYSNPRGSGGRQCRRCVHGHVGFQQRWQRELGEPAPAVCLRHADLYCGRLRGDDRDHAGDHGGVDRRLSRHRRGLRTTRR
jgi:hypothetical protein